MGSFRPTDFLVEGADRWYSITSWWLNHPLETYQSKWESSSSRGESKAYLKPRPRYILYTPLNLTASFAPENRPSRSLFQPSIFRAQTVSGRVVHHNDQNNEIRCNVYIWFRIDFNHHQQSFSFIHNHTNINEETNTHTFYGWIWKIISSEKTASGSFFGVEQIPSLKDSFHPNLGPSSHHGLCECIRQCQGYPLLHDLHCFGYRNDLRISVFWVCVCVFFCWPLVNWRQDAKQQQKTPADMLGYTEILVLHSDSHWRSLLLVFNKTVSCCLPTVTQIVAKCFTNISLSDII